MNRKIKVMHTEWSDGWGGQEIRIISEMEGVRAEGVEVFLACKEDSQIKEKAIEKGFKVFILPFKGNTDLKTLHGLYSIIKKNKVNIVNTHSGKDTWVGGIAAKLAGVKFIRTRHLSNDIRASRLNFINEMADYIFTTGESIRDRMVQYNRINAENIESIPTGIDDEKFKPDLYDRDEIRKKLGIKDDELAIGIVAVLRAFKRHDRFVELVKKIVDSNKGKKIKFFIAGDGPQRKAIASKIDDLNLGQYITCLGHVKEVPVLLTALDIFVLTSDSKEGVPQSVMQALLMKKAVITTDAGSTGDLYKDSNFILVDRNDAEEMYMELNGLINNNDEIERYSNNARSYVCDNFSHRVMIKKIMTVYEKLNG